MSRPRDEVESRYADKRGPLAAGRRLGCQARICGDLVIDVPPESQVHRQVVRKRAETHPIEIDPVVRLYYVEVGEPDMHEPASDLRRLQQALSEQWGLAETNVDLATLATLQKTLRAGQWKVTAALRKGRDIVAIMPGFAERAYGVAIDVGSTTIAAHLTDLATGEVVAAVGAMNPQIRFGEDLMSRVSYVMMNPGGDKELTRVVREAMDGLIGEAAREAGVSRGEIMEVTMVGNPIMHHLVLGLDPTELGGAPFALTIDGAYEARARELGLDIAPGAFVYALPCIAGHVGADAAGVVLAEGAAPQGRAHAPRRRRHQRRDRVRQSRAPARLLLADRPGLRGGADLLRPARGAGRNRAGAHRPRDARAAVQSDRLRSVVRRAGLRSGDRDDRRHRRLRLGDHRGDRRNVPGRIVSEDGVIDGGLASRTKRVEQVGRTFAYVLREGQPRLLVYQTDVRAIQLAKAALYAGAKLLMERAGAAPERVTLAGAFGSHIDPLYAMTLGLIPDCDLAKVASAGNAAGTGARIALLNLAARAEIESVVRGIEKIETAIEPAFQRHFVAAMAFPNKEDAFPNLSQRIDLPARQEPSGQGGRRRRRRRAPADSV